MFYALFLKKIRKFHFDELATGAMFERFNQREKQVFEWIKNFKTRFWPAAALATLKQARPTYAKKWEVNKEENFETGPR